MSESEFELEGDDVLRNVAAELRVPVSPSEGFDARLMARVRAEAAAKASARGARARLRAAARWLVEPRRVELSPLAGLAVAAGLAGAVVLGSGALGRGTEPAAVAPAPSAAGPAALSASHASSAPTAGQAVQFVVAVPQASRVTLVGDFNDWNAEATPLHPVVGRPGVWAIEVPLDAGRHEYAFVVDGERWMPDPAAPAAVADDFGTPNSVITVSERVS
jgi:hypothetical protein